MTTCAELARGYDEVAPCAETPLIPGSAEGIASRLLKFWSFTAQGIYGRFAQVFRATFSAAGFGGRLVC